MAADSRAVSVVTRTNAIDAQRRTSWKETLVLLALLIDLNASNVKKMITVCNVDKAMLKFSATVLLIFSIRQIDF